MANLFFLLSGEHETLPASELKAILEAEEAPFRILGTLDQVVRLETDLSILPTIKRRSALTRLGGVELVCCDTDTSTIVKAIRSINLEPTLKKGESFAVRVRRVKKHAGHVDGRFLERKLGELILKATDQTKVNLTNPDRTFLGILTDTTFIFGVQLVEIPVTPYIERRPKKKPFFHPSAMPAKLAMCMVNLAKPKPADLVFDPFCGTGSLLIEAALIGCRVLGLDLQKRMIKGTLQNFAHFNIQPEGVMVADARNAPVAKVDCVVTDPPYGRSATTFHRSLRQVVEDAFIAVGDMLDTHRRVCISTPHTLHISRLIPELGYTHVESHFLYIHRSLTREIAVFEKV